MDQWYLNTDNQSLIDAYRRAPFDLMSFDTHGKTHFHSKMNCVGVGEDMEYFMQLLAYNDIRYLVEPLNVFQDGACVVIMTRERGVEMLGDAWFNVDPAKIGLNAVPKARLVEAGNNTKVFSTTSSDTIPDVYHQLRQLCVGRVVCHLDGSGEVTSPGFFGVYMDNEADAVTVAMGLPLSDVKATTTTFSIAGVTFASSNFIMTGSLHAQSLYSVDLSPALNIRSGDLTINGNAFSVETDDGGEIVVRAGKPGEQYVLHDTRDRSVDCVYAPLAW